MNEKDQKLQEMEQQLAQMQQEVNSLRQGGRRKRKAWKVILIVVGAIFVLVAAAFIAVFALMARDQESPAMAEQLIQAVIDQDADRAYALTYPGLLDREEFDQGFREMCRVWQALGGGDAFQLKRTGWEMNTSNGVTQYTTQYRVTSGEAQFSFELVRVVQGDKAGLISARITQYLPG